MRIAIREIEASDCELIVDYFQTATPEFILGMGASPDRLPERKVWIEKLQSEISKPYDQKSFYVIIWLLDGEAIGHSNLADIRFGIDAKMHLHLWKNEARRKGLGFKFLKRTIPDYFNNFKLDKLICEPYALNPAPINTLKKVGYHFIGEFETTPGYLNFPQKVKRFELDQITFEKTMNNDLDK